MVPVLPCFRPSLLSWGHDKLSLWRGSSMQTWVFSKDSLDTQSLNEEVGTWPQVFSKGNLCDSWLCWQWGTRPRSSACSTHYCPWCLLSSSRKPLSSAMKALWSYSSLPDSLHWSTPGWLSSLSAQMAHTFPTVDPSSLPFIECHSHFLSATSPSICAYVCQRDDYISLLSNDISFVLAFPRKWPIVAYKISVLFLSL